MRVSDRAFLRLKVLRASFSCDLKAIEGRFEVVNSRRQHNVFAVLLEEDMSQSGTEIGPIKSISAHRDVHLFALGAIDFDSILTKLVA